MEFNNGNNKHNDGDGLFTGLAVTVELGVNDGHSKHDDDDDDDHDLSLGSFWLVNLEFLMAMAGILLMVVENELYYANHEEKDTAVSFVIKLTITITTIVLLGAICLYYQVHCGYIIGVYQGFCVHTRYIVGAYTGEPVNKSGTLIVGTF